MRANEIIRGLLDFIDGVDGGKSQPTVQISMSSTPVAPEPISVIDVSPEHDHPEDLRRFKQIVDLASEPKHPSLFANSPNEKYADIDAVTVDAGGGLNGPKHPHDIRVKDPSAYPHTQDQSPNLEPHSDNTPSHSALINAMRGLT